LFLQVCYDFSSVNDCNVSVIVRYATLQDFTALCCFSPDRIGLFDKKLRLFQIDMRAVDET